MNRKTNKHVADVCLYGTSQIGAGWIAQGEGQAMIGTGEPISARGFTEAVWLACDALRESGIKAGMVRVFAAGGERMAFCDINHPPYYGNLKWQPAIQYEVAI